MKKVYNNGTPNKWFLTEISDIYLFKYLDKKTNQEKDGILSWKKSIKNSEHGINEEDRLYGIDIDDEEVLFVESYKEGRFILQPKQDFILDLIENEKGIIFIGDSQIHHRS